MNIDKEAIKAEAEKRLAELEAMGEDLKTKLVGVGQDVRADYEKQIAAVGEKQQALRVKVQALREAGDDAWDDLKKGLDEAWVDVESAWGTIKQALGEAAARFSSDSEPKS